MRKSAFVILLFALILVTGYTQAQSSDSIKSKGHIHRGHGWHYKKNPHDKENRSVHRQGHHHERSSLQTRSRSDMHHGGRTHREEKTKESNK